MSSNFYLWRFFQLPTVVPAFFAILCISFMFYHSLFVLGMKFLKLLKLDYSLRKQFQGDCHPSINSWFPKGQKNALIRKGKMGNHITNKGNVYTDSLH